MSQRSVDRTFSRSFAIALAVLPVSMAGGIAVATAPSTAQAYDLTSPADLNLDQRGVALRGFDTVAYFIEGKAVEGSPQFNATYEGATYYFASAKSREAFVADPTKYIPQFGGFCAMGVAMGIKLDGDPNLFRVVNGKLYVNVNEAAQKRWLQDIPGHVQRADTTWPSIAGKTPQELTQ